MSKEKPFELHPDIKSIVYHRIKYPTMTQYDEDRLKEIREDILKRIKEYKRVKADILRRKAEHESLKNWVEENNINLDIEENGK